MRKKKAAKAKTLEEKGAVGEGKKGVNGLQNLVSLKSSLPLSKT